MKSTRWGTILFIAKRYLFAKKQHHIVNIIAWISIAGISVSTAALVIVLSVFNGMETLVQQSFNSFNPDLCVTPAKGKSFALDTVPLALVRQIPSVMQIEEVVSDLVLAEYEHRQVMLHLKGVPANYVKHRQMEKILIDGNYRMGNDIGAGIVIGAGAAGLMQINLNSLEGVCCYYPNRMSRNLLPGTGTLNSRTLLPSGVFSTNAPRYDEQFAFCDLQVARELMQYENEVTALEIQLQPHASLDKTREKVKQCLGKNYEVKDRYQQEEILYKSIKAEKWIIFFILAFIVLVSAFNILGTMGMLMVEKRKDLLIYRSMGASVKFTGKIFMVEGMFVALIGGMFGLFLGTIICALQQQFHFISLGNGGASYIVNYYPVKILFPDLLLTFLLVLVISFIASWFPVKMLDSFKEKNWQY
ncbi:MAG: ABC transporter permease [Bacteroidales bacterium]|nr:ABC transporter permease [Bacteroidales bacterium]